MKIHRLTAVAVAAVLLAEGCSLNGDENGNSVVCPPAETYTAVLDFESAELGTAEYEGFIPTVFGNVLEGKSLASRCEDEESLFWDTMFYEGPLFSSDGIGICTMYNDGEWMGYGKYDSWSGFAVSSNCDVADISHTNQFSIWDAANGSNKFAVGYDSPSGGMNMGLTYDTPTIVLDKAGTVKSIDFMNTTYTAETIASYDREATYVLRITGYLNGTVTGTAYVTLAEGGVIADEWLTVDTEELGMVDTVTVQADMEKTVSTVQKPEQWLPLFFCIDNVTVVFPK